MYFVYVQAVGDAVLPQLPLLLDHIGGGLALPMSTSSQLGRKSKRFTSTVISAFF